MHHRRAAACSLYAVVALLLVACGGPPATATAPPPTVPASSVAVAASAPTFTAGASPGQSAIGTAVATAVPTTVPTPPPTAVPTSTATTSATPRVAMVVSPGARRFAIDPQRSQAIYRVGEKFLGQGISVRVATVSGVGGDLYIDRQRPAASSASAITVDIRGMTSDMTGHDRVRNDFLETRRYPNVTFTPQRLVGLPDTPLVEGTPIAFQLVGELTVRQTSRPVTFEATGTLSGTTFTGTAEAKIQITDFGFTLPTMATLELDNNVYLEIIIVAAQAP